MTCSADEHAQPFNTQVRGVNLGGWMVLEPWITPSLFYQFLGGGINTTAFDMYTFCEVLGPEEANKQLRRHWERWVTEDLIAELAQSGAVNSLRLPVGDFLYQPYGPYPGCVDGALDFIDELLDWAYSHGVSVLIDIHTMKESQNGFDNSGQSMGFAWTSALSSDFAGLTTFEHWPIRTAEWIGNFDPRNASYTAIKYENIEHALKVIETVVDTYKGHPAVKGIEPVNEPWQYTPLDTLKRFYWEGYLIVKRKAPYWKYVMHDSFRFTPDTWGGFMDGCPDRVLDTHIYQAWHDPDTRIAFFSDACRQKSMIATMEREFGPVIVGEWSLATDNCAMWLNGKTKWRNMLGRFVLQLLTHAFPGSGFNDNLPGFPRLPCKYTPCPESYLGHEQPGVPLDPFKPIQGPYGTGMSGPSFALCPGTRDWLKESSGNPLTGRDGIRAPPNAPKHLDDTDDVMRHLAYKKLDAFAGIGHGFCEWNTIGFVLCRRQYIGTTRLTAACLLFSILSDFWNFRSEDPQWSYLTALERGWIPRGDLHNDPNIQSACAREDKGEFKCVLKKGQIDSAVLDAVGYVLNVQNLTDTERAQRVLNMTGDELTEEGGKVLSDYFQEYRHMGATCDFGGIAMLIEENRTLSDDDIYLTDDEYFGYVIRERPAVWKLGLGGVSLGLVGALIGFVLAMRYSRKFNEKVRRSTFFKPITQSQNRLVRSSLHLGRLPNINEHVPLNDEKWNESYGGAIQS